MKTRLIDGFFVYEMTGRYLGWVHNI